ncbi:hypothetical protein V1511DRAFT_491298 [Dipodascopsis uninucleata]
MAHMSEYQGAIALLDLDRSVSNGTSKTSGSKASKAAKKEKQEPQEPDQQEQSLRQQQSLPRIVMPESEEQEDIEIGQRENIRHHNRTSIANLLADSSGSIVENGHLQASNVYTNSANPPIDTQLLSPMSNSSATPSASTSGQSNTASSPSMTGNLSGTGSQTFGMGSPPPVSPDDLSAQQQQISLPRLPAVIMHDDEYRHRGQPGLQSVIPAHPVRTGAHAQAEYQDQAVTAAAAAAAAAAAVSQLHPSPSTTKSQNQPSARSGRGSGSRTNNSPPASSSQSPSTARPYKCPHAGCKWTFARHSDQRRHLRSHYSPNFHCPYWRTDPTCHRNGGAFNRLDVLKRHLRLVHFVQLKDTDAGWCRLCQKMFPSPRVFVEHCEKCAESVQPTEWKKSSSERPDGSESVAEENQ